MSKFIHILEFKDIDREDISEVGSKAANLGELVQNGFNVPQGFVIPSSVFKLFIKENSFKTKINALLSTINVKNAEHLQSASSEIVKMLNKGKMPESVTKEVKQRYENMGSMFKYANCAVRSSPTSNGSREKTFIGLHESYLNVIGNKIIFDAIINCWASLFSARAIFHREQNNIDHFKVGIAVIIQEMIQSQVSGIAFTSNPGMVTKNQMIIEAVWGLGKHLTQGSITPDKYTLDRHTLELIDIKVSTQDLELVKNGQDSKRVKVPNYRREKQKLSNENIKQLGRILQKINTYYYFPQNVEWIFAKDKFFIVESSPLAISTELPSKVEELQKNSVSTSEILLQGNGVMTGIVTGIVRVLISPKDSHKLKKDEILVVPMTSPDYIHLMKKASAIIADQGGVTSHAALVSRELGIPCILGTEKATKILKDGMVITLNAKEGVVYKGIKSSSSKFKFKEEIKQEEKPREDVNTATKIYINLADPEHAHEASKLPVEGIGLLRAEFMISQIGSHPKHMIARGLYKEYIDKLTNSISIFCKEFEPRPVIYRTSDFKTSEYKNLIGGKPYEPEEENPMLGYRGAFRYISEPEIFELELAAIKKVRETYKNLWVMIPFVRSPEELLQVKRIMAANGLMRSPTLKMWMMVEIPVNVILIEDFIKVGIDGISFGTNDLTMLTEGIDRDNSELATIFNEISPAVLWSLKRVIKACHKHKIQSSICGQAISSYDTLIQEVVNLGIGSVSVNTDALGRVQKTIYEAERRLVR